MLGFRCAAMGPGKWGLIASSLLHFPLHIKDNVSFDAELFLNGGRASRRAGLARPPSSISGRVMRVIARTCVPHLE